MQELPHCFIAGAEGVPSWGERLARLQGAFSEAFVRASPDFQTDKGYEKDQANQANMVSGACSGFCGLVLGDMHM